MITVRSKVLFLVVCLVEVVWLLMAQILGNALFLMLCLMCFLALAIWAAIKGMTVPVLLFFLPFATLLKTAPGQLSFFTFALLAVYLICLVLGCRKINAIHVIPGFDCAMFGCENPVRLSDRKQLFAFFSFFVACSFYSSGIY